MKHFLIIIFFLNTYVFAQKVTLVHGLNGSGSVYTGSQVEQAVNDILNYPAILKPNLGGSSSANVQSNILKNALINNNVNSGLAVSHSMGGLVTRNYMMIENSGGYNRLNGHISIATPHLGAHLATNAALASDLIVVELNALLFPGGVDFANGIIYYTTDASLDLARILLSEFFANFIVFYTGNDAVEDLKTTSQVVNDINNSTGYEQDVFKGGIYCREDEPVLYNMASHIDFHVGSIHIHLTEAQVNNIVNVIYAAKAATIIWHLYQAYDYLDAGYYNLAELELAKANAQYSALVIFANFNYYWETYVLQSGHSDGVVEESSQKYPSANELYFADHSSHFEELNKSDVTSQVMNALDDYSVYVNQHPPKAPYNINATWQSNNPRNITWDPNQEPDIAGYDIYREIYYGSTVVSDIKLNSSLLTTLSFTDNKGIDLPSTGIPYGVDLYIRYKIKAVDDFSHVSDDGSSNSLLLGRAWDVSGTILGNSIWSGIIYLTGNVTVNPGVTLTIDPRTIIIYNNNFSLIVNGMLNVQGNTYDKVTFDFVSPNSSTQNGIKINNGGDADISYAVIKNAYRGVYIADNRPSISNSGFINCYYGIYLDNTNYGGYNQSYLTDNKIHGSDIGIVMYTSGPYITGNEIYNNRIAVGAAENSKPYLGYAGSYGNNNIHDNDYGIFAFDYSDPFLGRSTCTVQGGNNSITNSENYAVYAYDYCDIVAENNWWGSSSPSSSLFHPGNGGTIDYNPWLSQLPNLNLMISDRSNSPEEKAFDVAFSTQSSNSTKYLITNADAANSYNADWPIRWKLF